MFKFQPIIGVANTSYLFNILYYLFYYHNSNSLLLYFCYSVFSFYKLDYFFPSINLCCVFLGGLLVVVGTQGSKTTFSSRLLWSEFLKERYLMHDTPRVKHCSGICFKKLHFTRESDTSVVSIMFLYLPRTCEPGVPT